MANQGKARGTFGEGVINPGAAAVTGFGALYLAAIPLTTWLSAPNGILQGVTEGFIRLVPGGSTVTAGRVIPALSAAYVFVTFGLSGAASAAGQAMGLPSGLDNNHPRKHIHQLEGFPLRLRSAHYGLMENFPSFAIAAGLAQVLAPNNQIIVNLLSFHVLAKLLVYYPSYLANIAPPRTLAHIFSIASVINVCWRLATGKV